MAEHGALVKFGHQQHLIQLRDDGLLYMNTLLYFWGIEDGGLRGDVCDSVDEIARGHEGEVTLANATKAPLKITNWTLRIQPPEAEKINVFCMYALRPSAGTFPVDQKNLQFGDYALVVADAQQFIDRIGSHMESKAIRGKAGLVEYVDNEYTGAVGPFRKLMSFAYQSEWRLVCYDGAGGPRTIRIGSIADISTIMLSSEVNQRITV